MDHPRARSNQGKEYPGIDSPVRWALRGRDKRRSTGWWGMEDAPVAAVSAAAATASAAVVAVAAVERSYYMIFRIEHLQTSSTRGKGPAWNGFPGTIRLARWG